MNDTKNVPLAQSPPIAHDPAGEFRAELKVRREAEDVIADALTTRKQAAAYADEMIRHAEILAREIGERASVTARVTTDEAKARADQILADAEAEAARVKADAELGATRARREEAQHLAEVSERARQAIRRLEAVASQAQLTLEQAQADLLPLAEFGAGAAAGPPSTVMEAQSDGGQHDRRRNPFRSLY